MFHFKGRTKARIEYSYYYFSSYSQCRMPQSDELLVSKTDVDNQRFKSRALPSSLLIPIILYTYSSLSLNSNVKMLSYFMVGPIESDGIFLIQVTDIAYRL